MSDSYISPDDFTPVALRKLRDSCGGCRAAVRAIHDDPPGDNRHWTGTWQRTFKNLDEEPDEDLDESPDEDLVENISLKEADLLAYIQKHRDVPLTIVALADHFDCSPHLIKEHLSALREQYYDVQWIDENEIAVSMPKDAAYNIPRHIKTGWRQREFRLGVVSDTHSGSLWADSEVLEDIYDRFLAEGVSEVLHPGDITHGPGMRGYRGHLYEARPDCQGPDGVIEYTIETYPRRRGITTRFISGNHDDWEWQASGRDICKEIADKREDLDYLGRSQADLLIGPDQQTKLRLWHPSGGMAYARSYKAQKNVEAMLGGTKPHILLIGHYHVAGWFAIRNVHTLLCGCVEWQTPYMARKSLQPEVGAYILDLLVDDDGWVRELTPRWLYYYYPKSNI